MCLDQTFFRALILLTAAACASAVQAAPCNTVARPLTVTATALNFGTYNPSTADTANMTVTVSCVIGGDTLPAFVATLSRGSSPTYTPRTMLSGANTLNYNIYNQAAFTTIWGDGTGGTLTRPYGGGGGSAAGTGFGQIPAGQYVNPGAYTDTITVTITY